MPRIHCATSCLPSGGWFVTSHPLRAPGCGVDTGIEEGSEVSMFYDPMIAKLGDLGGEPGSVPLKR